MPSLSPFDGRICFLACFGELLLFDWLTAATVSIIELSLFGDSLWWTTPVGLMVSLLQLPLARTHWRRAATLRLRQSFLPGHAWSFKRCLELDKVYLAIEFDDCCWCFDQWAFLFGLQQRWWSDHLGQIYGIMCRCHLRLNCTDKIEDVATVVHEVGDHLVEVVEVQEFYIHSTILRLNFLVNICEVKVSHQDKIVVWESLYKIFYAGTLPCLCVWQWQINELLTDYQVLFNHLLACRNILVFSIWEVITIYLSLINIIRQSS